MDSRDGSVSRLQGPVHCEGVFKAYMSCDVEQPPSSTIEQRTKWLAFPVVPVLCTYTSTSAM